MLFSLCCGHVFAFHFYIFRIIVLSISHVKEKAVLSAKFLTDNIEHGIGCVEESDYRVIKEVINSHREDLIKCRNKLEAERHERPSLAGVKMPARGSEDVDYEWAMQWMPPAGNLSKDTTLHMRWKVDMKCSDGTLRSSKVWGQQTRPHSEAGPRTRFTDRLGLVRRFC